jgi:hypothetical protein
MTTNALRLVGSVGSNERASSATMLLARIHQCVCQFMCGVFGHERVLHSDANRIYLQCLRCGAQTRGWIIDVKPAFRRRTGQGPAASPQHAARMPPQRAVSDAGNTADQIA